MMPTSPGARPRVSPKNVAGLTPKTPTSKAPRKANASKIQSSAPALASDIKRYTVIKHNTKAERNQNIARAFYQGGDSQTVIALAFELSSSTVSRVVKEYEDER